ncbi:MAG: alpha/beta hydrolase [Acidobacteriota bacterium]
MTTNPFEQLFAGDLFVRRRRVADAKGTLLFIHGLGESGLGFESLFSMPSLADWSLLVPDLAGYGKSPWPDAPIGLDGHADLLARWSATQTDGPVVIVGHSMGGAIGTAFAERAPERTRAFFNIEGNVTVDDCTFSGPMAAQELADFVASGFEGMRREVYAAGVDDLPLRTYFASLQLCDPRTFHRDARELVAVSEQENLALRLAALGIPAIYLYGSPRGTAARSRGHLADAEIEIVAIDEAGHWPWIDQPEAFEQALAAFLGSLDEASA